MEMEILSQREMEKEKLLDQMEKKQRKEKKLKLLEMEMTIEDKLKCGSADSSIKRKLLDLSQWEVEKKQKDKLKCGSADSSIKRKLLDLSQEVEKKQMKKKLLEMERDMEKKQMEKKLLEMEKKLLEMEMEKKLLEMERDMQKKQMEKKLLEMEMEKKLLEIERHMQKKQMEKKLLEMEMTIEDKLKCGSGSGAIERRKLLEMEREMEKKQMEKKLLEMEKKLLEMEMEKKLLEMERDMEKKQMEKKLLEMEMEKKLLEMERDMQKKQMEKKLLEMEMTIEDKLKCGSGSGAIERKLLEMKKKLLEMEMEKKLLQMERDMEKKQMEKKFLEMEMEKKLLEMERDMEKKQMEKKLLEMEMTIEDKLKCGSGSADSAIETLDEIEREPKHENRKTEDEIEHEPEDRKKTTWMAYAKRVLWSPHKLMNALGTMLKKREDILQKPLHEPEDRKKTTSSQFGGLLENSKSIERSHDIKKSSYKGHSHKVDYRIMKEKLETLNRKKDLVCAILSYSTNMVDKDRHESWIQDILKINGRVGDVEILERRLPKHASEIYSKIVGLLDHSMDDIEAYVPPELFEKMCEQTLKVEMTATMHTEVEIPSSSEIRQGKKETIDAEIEIVPSDSEIEQGGKASLLEEKIIPKEILDLAVGFATDQILKNIKNPSMRRIGISGRDGIRVISELKDRPQLGEEFAVIFVPASSCSSVKLIEGNIAARFDFSTSSRLDLNDYMKGVNFLILLEDVHEMVELRKVGIKWWNAKKIQKIVSATRFQKVHQKMAVDLEIRLEDHLLSWLLFCMNVGEVVHSPCIQCQAIGVVKACSGHLLAIVLMARALKEVNDVCTWKDASLALGLQAPTQMEDKVLFNALAFIWEHLDSAKDFVEYCALSMERDGMDKVHLVQEWIRRTLTGTVEEGEKIVEALVNALLLESCPNGDSLRMRDEIREVLLKMFRSETDPPFLRLSGKELTAPPINAAWEKARWMDLTNNKLSELPDSPNCPQLRYLSLQINPYLRDIPSSFFEHMHVLQILNLSYTRINTLPASLSKLGLLRDFFLRGCELLMELPPEVGELKNLEVLDLEGTEILNLPMDVGKLTNLKCLKVSFYGYNHQDRKNSQSNTMVPQNVISNLVQLAELGIDVNPDDERWNVTVKHVVKEVCNLKQLKALKLYLPEVVLLEAFMGVGTSSPMYLSFVQFGFTIGRHLKYVISRLPGELEVKFEQQQRRLRYVNGENVPEEIKEALQHATALFLDRHSTITSISQFGIENMKKLEFCVLGECNEIQTVIDGAGIYKRGDDGDDGDVSDESVLGSLCYLGIYHMKSLRSIWKGPILKGCLPNLKSLALHTCPQLITVFTLALLENLNTLEELLVEDCPEVVSLVNCEVHEDRSAPNLKWYLPRLKKISLHHMPKFVSISSGLRIAPKLEWMSFYGCWSLKTLSMEEVSIIDLKVIIGEADWWNSLQLSRSNLPYNLDSIFVPIKRDRDLRTQLTEIGNQRYPPKQETKHSQQPGSADSLEGPAVEARTSSKGKQLYDPAPSQPLLPASSTQNSIKGMADVVAGAAGATAVEVYKDGRSLLTSASSKIAYVKDLKKNYMKLMQEAGKLWELKDAIETEISRHKIRPVTREWIVKVEMISREVGELETKYNDEKKHPWRLVRILRHSNLSKDVVEKHKQVQNLLEEGNVKRGVLVAELPEPVRKMYALKLENNSSLHRVVEDVVSLLEDKQIRRIGIWGIVGTGKTTIMQNLNNHKDIAKMFDIVIYVTVSKDWSLQKLQDVIMLRLKLNMESTVGIEENAWRISEELKGKKYLILLDEVCDFIDLHEVMGIQDHQESKVVLASRLRDICKDMEVDELVNVKPLLNDEAFNMFREIVGQSILFPRIEDIAHLVVRECGGLPLLIDRVARTFKKKASDVHLWREGFNRLRRAPMRVEGMDQVIEYLTFCYHDLDSDKKKACFLYCALFPKEDEIYIDYLLECWRAEGFIHDTDKFTDRSHEGHEILNDLLGSSFLERSEKRRHCVKMNKTVRDMALNISSKYEYSKFLVKPCEELQEPPSREEWEHASRISLINNLLPTLPETMDCRNLLTLFLQGNKKLISIPEFFFESMRSLRVLDLHGTGISSLPSSLSNLVCLGALYVNFCIHLKEVPSDIKALKRLEVLDIRGTKLNLSQIGSLMWLKVLRISWSSFCLQSATQREFGSISAFASLENFCVEGDTSGKARDEDVENFIMKVAALQNLTSLQFCFPTIGFLKLFVTRSSAWQKNSRFTFQFSVGYRDPTCSQMPESSDFSSCNHLTLVNPKGPHLKVSEVLMQTNAFSLINYQSVSTLSAFGMENLDELLVCLIEECNDLEVVVDGNETKKGVLGGLKYLHINNVLKLESIWQGPVHVGSLHQLSTLTLAKCPKLKKIFSNGMIQQLHQLQHLTVEECHQIEEIIMESENHGLAPNALPRLKSLVLLDLPELKSIWIDNSLEWPSLQKIQISACSKLKRLPFNMVNATKLRFIEGQSSWWEALEWTDVDGGAIKQRLEPLCILK